METAPRRRDAAHTRQQLLDAARRRFAADGYSATSVREIAADAGVNVALISRYFTSKEGLFRACLTGTGDELRRTVTDGLTLETAPHVIAAKLVMLGADRQPGKLMLLLRSSGDETADRIRRDILGSFAERLAAAVGTPAGGEQNLINAQIVLAAGMGIAMLRTAGLEPLAGAGQEQLAAPLGKMITALMADAP